MKTSILLNKLFTVKSLEKLVSGNNIKTYQQLLMDFHFDKTSSMSNGQAFTELYKYMSKEHRNEYFYKNTLFNKILIGRHSVNTSTALRELPIAGNILDFLIINGVGQVYEIKTELDNFKRLQTQIESYYRAFSLCNIVIDESHFKELSQIDLRPEVGVIILTKRNTLHVYREPVQLDEKLDYLSMFKILRKYEFEELVRTYFGFLPQCNAFEYYEACYRLFSQIPIKQAQQYMLQELKQRTTVTRDLSKAFKQVPYELKTLVYFSKYQQTDFDTLSSFLNESTERI